MNNRYLIPGIVVAIVTLLLVLIVVLNQGSFGNGEPFTGNRIIFDSTDDKLYLSSDEADFVELDITFGEGVPKTNRIGDYLLVQGPGARDFVYEVSPTGVTEVFKGKDNIAYFEDKDNKIDAFLGSTLTMYKVDGIGFRFYGTCHSGLFVETGVLCITENNELSFVSYSESSWDRTKTAEIIDDTYSYLDLDKGKNGEIYVTKTKEIGDGEFEHFVQVVTNYEDIAGNTGLIQTESVVYNVIVRDNETIVVTNDPVENSRGVRLQFDHFKIENGKLIETGNLNYKYALVY